MFDERTKEMANAMIGALRNAIRHSCRVRGISDEGSRRDLIIRVCLSHHNSRGNYVPQNRGSQADLCQNPSENTDCVFTQGKSSVELATPILPCKTQQSRGSKDTA